MKETLTMAATTIKEINNQYSYKDENPNGKTDASLVSCAQCENYNELTSMMRS